MGMMAALRFSMGGWLMAALTYPRDQLWRLQLIPWIFYGYDRLLSDRPLHKTKEQWKDLLRASLQKQ